MTHKYNLARASDKDLTEALKDYIEQTHELTAIVVAHIAEFDARRLYLGHACSSMHVYCTERLAMTDAQAYRRIHAARAARQHPEIFDLLAQGELHVSHVTLLAPKLTQVNGGELISAARRKSERELELLLADRFPQPDVPATVRKLPALRPRAPAASAQQVRDEETSSAPSVEEIAPKLLAPQPIARPAIIAPLAPARFKVQFTAGQELHDKLEQAQALLRHQIPDGDIATIFDRALSMLLDEVKSKKLAATSKPRKPKTRSTDEIANEPGAPETASGSRHIPAEVKREVANRDGLQCAFTDDTGRRCNETGFLEFHHLQPHGKGGPPTVENIAIFCHAHNQHAARRDYGAEMMTRCHERALRGSQARETGQRTSPGTSKFTYAAQNRATRPGRGAGRPSPTCP